jgi:hypothetical protein
LSDHRFLSSERPSRDRLREGLAHANFAVAVVVVPAVIHKGNSTVDRAANDFNAVRLRKQLFPNMVSAQPNDRDFLFGASEGAIKHVATTRFQRPPLLRPFGRRLSG